MLRSLACNSRGEEISRPRDALQRKKPIDQAVMAYEIIIRGKQGQLDIQKCMELKIPTGPLLGMLKKGLDVELEGNFF